MAQTNHIYLSLREAHPRRTYVISHFTDNVIASKLMSMGVLPGSVATLIRKSTFGNTLYFEIDNQILALRKEEAACIVLK